MFTKYFKSLAKCSTDFMLLLLFTVIQSQLDIKSAKAETVHLSFQEKETIFTYEKNAHLFPNYAANLFAGRYIGDSHTFSQQDNTDKYTVTITQLKPSVKGIDKYNIPAEQHIINLQRHYSQMPFAVTNITAATTAIATDQHYHHNTIKTRNSAAGAYTTSYILSYFVGEHLYQTKVREDSGVVILPVTEVFFTVDGTGEEGRFYQFNGNLQSMNLKVGDKLTIQQKEHLWFFNKTN